MTQQRSSATDQLAFWQGQFGDKYTERNAPTDESIRARIAAWSGILKGLAGAPPDSILEVGANLGLNLAALRAVTDATLYAVEPNGTARDRLASAEILPSDRILDASAASIGLADAAIDLVFTSGVLIHIAPENLLAAYREMHRVARRYLVTIEYFSDKEEIVPLPRPRGPAIQARLRCHMARYLRRCGADRLRLLLEACYRARQSDVVALQETVTDRTLRIFCRTPSVERHWDIGERDVGFANGSIQG